jgi:catechol 2,3-dioxygenase-like lactoylglutathione lyase family enzyme
MAFTSGFNHVATLTTDLERHAEFYEKAFDAKVTFTMEKTDDHPRMFILELGPDAALNVFEVPAEEIIGEQRSQGHRGAIDHFALAVKNRAELEEARERIIAAGGDVGDIQQLGAELSLFFRDIDGMELEVCCPADAG